MDASGTSGLRSRLLHSTVVSDPTPPAARAPRASWPRWPWGAAVILVLLLAALAAVERVVSPAAGLAERLDHTTVTQSVVVERVQEVAKLVSSETTVRDVVVYENTFYGSTKRSLVVVTGKILSGIDLDQGSDVRIDHEAKQIHVTLPHASVLGVDITEMRTYDEQRGLWNPFRPDDRALIYKLARAQLMHAGNDLQVVAHAEESARRLLQGLLATDGYTVDVTFVPRLAPAAPR